VIRKYLQPTTLLGCSEVQAHEVASCSGFSNGFHKVKSEKASPASFNRQGILRAIGGRLEGGPFVTRIL